MAEMLGSALVQEAVSRCSQGHLMERLEIAVSELDLALEKVKELPIRHAPLLRRWKQIKFSYVMAKELLNKHRQQAIKQKRWIFWARSMSITPSVALSMDDVRRFEWYADSAGKFVRDVEWSCSLHQYTIFNRFWRFELIVRKAIVIHCTPADQIVEQQERCSKYSQQAIGFAVSTFSGFLVSLQSSPTGDTAVKIATSAAFFVAIIADLVSWKMKPTWGRALVYISSFHLLLMTFAIFVSFDKDYGYLILLILLIISLATTLRRKIWPGEWQQRRDDNTTIISQDHLDFMFDLSALILNMDTIITMIITISGYYPSRLSKYEAAKTTGFLFFSTIVLSLYLMMVATVRTVALTVISKYLDVLLVVLLVSALIATSITFIYLFNETLLEEAEVPT